MTPSVDPHGRPLIGLPTTSSTVRAAGAFESSSRFKGASEMEAKAIKSVDLIALACLMNSQDHLLVDPIPEPSPSSTTIKTAVAGRRAMVCDDATYLGG